MADMNLEEEEKKQPVRDSVTLPAYNMQGEKEAMPESRYELIGDESQVQEQDGMTRINPGAVLRVYDAKGNMTQEFTVSDSSRMDAELKAEGKDSISSYDISKIWKDLQDDKDALVASKLSPVEMPDYDALKNKRIEERRMDNPNTRDKLDKLEGMLNRDGAPRDPDPKMAVDPQQDMGREKIEGLTPRTFDPDPKMAVDPNMRDLDPGFSRKSNERDLDPGFSRKGGERDLDPGFSRGAYDPDPKMALDPDLMNRKLTPEDLKRFDINAKPFDPDPKMGRDGQSLPESFPNLSPNQLQRLEEAMKGFKNGIDAEWNRTSPTPDKLPGKADDMSRMNGMDDEAIKNGAAKLTAEDRAKFTPEGNTNGGPGSAQMDKSKSRGAGQSEGRF